MKVLVSFGVVNLACYLHQMSNIQYMDRTNDPATVGWPPSLPLELALHQQPVRDICGAYGIDRFEYERLRADENFRRAVEEALETLKDESASFKLKARAQSEELLKTSWALIHQSLDKVPANVKADLIKFTIKCAGLDASIEQRATVSAKAIAQNAVGLTINLHLD